MQRAVTEHDEVEQGQVAGAGQQDLVGRGQADPSCHRCSIGRVWRMATISGRLGRVSAFAWLTKTGRPGGRGGSHNPCSTAPVRWVRQPEGGRTCCHATRSARSSSSGSPGLDARR